MFERMCICLNICTGVIERTGVIECACACVFEHACACLNVHVYI